MKTGASPPGSSATTSTLPEADPWYVVTDGNQDAALNMALDAAWLEAAPNTRHPLLRFYGWSGTPASFGYFQKQSTAAALTRLRPLVRRPTGGGVVNHADDWTYSLVVPASHPWYALRAHESYRRIHEWILAALPTLAPRLTLASTRASGAPGSCFARAERNDLVFDGQKIAGAAQRRKREGLLIQGSINATPISATRLDWQAAMLDAATQRWNINWTPLPTPPAIRHRALELATAIYASTTFLHRI